MQSQSMLVRRAIVAAVAVAVLACSGCAPPERGSVPAREHAPSDHLAAATPERSPVHDAASLHAAADHAAQTVTAYVRKDLGQREWFTQLMPYLDERAALVLANLDPEQIAATRVTGPPAAGAQSSGYLVSARVPTDAGALVVLLVRESADSPWLAASVQAEAAA